MALPGIERTAPSDALDAILSDLNDRQRAAVTHGDSPLLVVAGAGTGKTTTLAHRVASLMATGTPPERILLLTFTRRAAAEMLRRVDAIFRNLSGTTHTAKFASRKVWGGTFHAVASRLLRQHGKLIGLDQDFTILDRGDAEDLMHLVRDELGFSNAESRFPLKGTCLDIYSRCVNTQARLEPILQTSFPWCFEHASQLKELFRAYVDRKEAQAVLDYDDLLLFWNALAADERTGKILREKFDCVLVDEYQDTNVLQSTLLKHLKPDGMGLTVVGDDAQSIYSFRAATVRNILDFPKEYPGTTIVALEQNYRSTQPILDATNAVIGLAAERHAKNLWSKRTVGDRPTVLRCQDEDEQTEFVIDSILDRRERGVALKNQAVLFRASHHSMSLELELSRRNVPFHKYGGVKFVETAHVKDLLAFLRLAENPRDAVAATRLLLLLPGIGPVKARQLAARLSSAHGVFEAWKDFQPPAATATHWPLLLALLRLLSERESESKDVPAQVHQVRTFYRPLLEQKYDQVQPRLRDLEQLEHLASRFPDRATFLTELALDPPASTQDFAGPSVLDEDYLILSTIHSAKGLEWDSVYVLHAADGNIPSDMSTRSPEEIEEERRLFYVALTRAKNQLVVCHPQRYYFHGRHRSDAHSFSQLTRFLPQQVLAHFEPRWAQPAEADAVDPADTPKTSEVRAQLKSIWN